MNSTSRGCRLVRIAARSPARAITGSGEAATGRVWFEVREKDGNKVLAKTIDNKFFQRGTVFIGDADMKNYTIQADVFSDGNKRKMSEVGVICQRYLVVLKGNDQKLEINSNLERLRETIAGYRMAMRSPDRPKDEETGSTQRAPRRRRGANSLSVTVSIGVAERDEVLDQPYAVLKEADKALYRAKREGRNRVVPNAA